jgi:hypothetical protein
MANPVVENALNLTRMVKTVGAARRFDRARTLPQATDGQSQFNMRQAMSLDPRVGKWLSRVTFRHDSPLAWQVANPVTSNFLDPGEIETAVSGIRRDGFYVFDSLAPSHLVDAIRSHAEQAPCTARGAGTSPATYPRTDPAAGVDASRPSHAAPRGF